MQEKLQQTMRLLARQRAILNDAEANLGIAQEELEKTIAYKKMLAFKDARDKQSNILKMLDVYCRSLLLKIYDETKNKKPIAGGSVRVTPKPIYNEEKVTEWCRVNAPDLLVLDNARWKRVGESLGSGLISHVDVPTAAIAGDLTELEDTMGIDEDIAAQVFQEASNFPL